MAKTSGKTYTDPEIGQVLFRKSTRSRSISIRVHPVKGVTVSVPYIIPYAVAHAFFLTRRQWVIATIAKQKEKYKDTPVPSAHEIEDMRKAAKTVLPTRLAELAARYGFIYNRVSIKHNTSNWGSCSTKANINLNLNLVRLPKVLQDYVLIHELCHLRHHDHGHAFHVLLESLLMDNLVKHIDAGDSLSLEIARKVAVSKARYPADYIMTKRIKEYRPV